MKKRKGNNIPDLAMIMAFCLLGSIGMMCYVGPHLGNIIKTHNSSRMHLNKSIVYEKPENFMDSFRELEGDQWMNITSYIAIPKLDGSGTVGVGYPLASVIKNNFRNGEYVQTSGSSGRNAEMAIKELPAANVNYIIELWDILDSNQAWFDNSTPERSISVYNELFNILEAFRTDLLPLKDSFDTSTTSIEDKLISLKIINLMKGNVDTSSGLDANDLNNDFSHFFPNLPISPTKSIMAEYSIDLRSISESLEYSLDDSLYTEILGADKNNTVAQDVLLINTMSTQYAALGTQAEKDNFNNLYDSKIQVVVTKNYTDMLPRTANYEDLNNTVCSGTCDPMMVL